jgi:hypothetical protein
MTTTVQAPGGYLGDTPNPSNGPLVTVSTIGGKDESYLGAEVVEETGPEEKLSREERALKTEPSYLEKLKARGKKGGRRTGKIEIVRPNDAGEDEMVLVFHVQSLREAEYTKIRERNTSYERNQRLGGMRVPRNLDAVRFRSELIYEATVEKDRAEFWDNRELCDIYGVMDGIDCVEAVLLAGEKDKVVTVIETLSGFTTEYDSEAVKNS